MFSKVLVFTSKVIKVFTDTLLFTSFYHLLSFITSLRLPKKQISSFCKLNSEYGKIPQDFLNDTDVYSYFYCHIFDISQSHYRIIRVSKGSNKKSFPFKKFQFCGSKLQQRFILKEEVSFFKKESESLLDSLGEFLKAFDQANKVPQIQLPKPIFEIGFVKAKDEVFSHYCKDIVEHLNRQIGLSFRFEKNKTCVFTIKTFEHYGDQFSCKLGLPRNQTSLQELTFCCLKV